MHVNKRSYARRLEHVRTILSTRVPPVRPPVRLRWDRLFKFGWVIQIGARVGGRCRRQRVGWAVEIQSDKVLQSFAITEITHGWSFGRDLGSDGEWERFEVRDGIIGRRRSVRQNVHDT